MMQDQATYSGEPVRQSMPHLNDSPTVPAYDTFYRSSDTERIATALGWLSIGLGLAQLLAPRRVSRAIGVEQRPRLMRTLGVREIASGVGILSRRRTDNWLWTRVAGDAIDLALLGAAARAPGAGRRRVHWLPARSPAWPCSICWPASSSRAAAGKSRARPATLPCAWRKPHDQPVAARVLSLLARLRKPPSFMHHLNPCADRRQPMRWKAKAPAGMHVEWDAELETDERRTSHLAWHSLEGSDIDNAGTVRFEPAPGGRGTIVRVSVAYRPPLGKAGVTVATMFGEAALAADRRRPAPIQVG